LYSVNAEILGEFNEELNELFDFFVDKLPFKVKYEAILEEISPMTRRGSPVVTLLF
jgi:hypothetical protein